MQDKFVNKLKSYANTDYVFDAYPDIVKSVLVLDTRVTEFKLRLKTLKELKVAEVGATVPLTDAKLASLAVVVTNADVERSAIILYAQDNKLPVLQGKMPRNITLLNKGTLVERVSRYTSIHDEAVLLGAALVPFGCSSEVLTEQGLLLPELDKALNGTQGAIGDRTTGQDSRKEAFAEMDEFIKTWLDMAVQTRMKAFPAFVKAYKKAKILPKTPVRSKKDPAPKKPTTTTTKEEVTPDETATEPTNTTTTPDVTETPTTPTTPEETGTNETDVNGSQPEGQ